MTDSARVIAPADIVRAAEAWCGTPYRHQASLRGVGTDCLGLVRGVWREVIGNEPEPTPPYQPGWAEHGGSEALAEAAFRNMMAVALEDRQAGDVLLFRWRPHLPAKHAGIALARDRMIHAQEGAAVTAIALSPWWLRHLSHVFRFPGVTH